MEAANDDTTILAGEGETKEKPERVEAHEKKDVTKLKGSLSEVGNALRPTLPYKITVSRISDGVPTSENTVKRVHFIRHGQGFHNVAQAEWREAKKPGEPYWVSTDPDFHYLDPELTEIGKEQAIALQETTSDMSPELIIVSPMRRAIQTALLAFDKHVKAVSNTANETSSSTDTDSPSSSSTLKILAHESAHEISGKHTCDKRLSKTELMALYPMIDFHSYVQSEEDPFWGDGLTRETHASVAARGADLMEFIRSRPETEIVVAAHSTLLFSLMNAVVLAKGNNTDYDISWFGTGEMRSFYVEWEKRP